MEAYLAVRTNLAKARWCAVVTCLAVANVWAAVTSDAALVHPRGPLSPWGDVAHGNGRYVVVTSDAGNPEIMSSPDGRNWRSSTERFGIHFHQVIFAQNRFWAAGGEDDPPATILTSETGEEWQVAFSTRQAEVFTSILHANGVWLARGVSEDGPGISFVSSNGTDWAALPIYPPITPLAVKNGVWLGTGDYDGKLYTASNGVDWAEHGSLMLSPRTSLYGFTAGPDAFIAFGVSQREETNNYPYEPFLALSQDGANWTRAMLAVPQQLDGSFVQSVAYGNNGFVALLGRFTLAGPPINSEFLTSADGVTWQLHSFPVRTSLGKVAFAGGQYFITGAQGALFSSPDGVTWTQRLGSSTRHVRDLASRGSRHVAVGDNGLLLTSRNGVSWTRPEGITTDDLFAVESDRNGFVAVGGNDRPVLARSRGLGWQMETGLSGGALRGLVRDGNELLAVGLRGTVARINRRTWNVSQAAGEPDFRAVAKLKDQFIAVAHPDPAYPFLNADSQILTSPDGVTWTQRFVHSNLLSSIVAHADIAIAVGTFNTILVSSNGNDWIQVDRPTDNHLSSITFARGSFVAAGLRGTFYVSPDGLNWNEQRYGAYPVFAGTSPNVWLATGLYGESPWVASANNRLYGGPGLEYIFRFGRSTLHRVSTKD